MAQNSIPSAAFVLELPNATATLFYAAFGLLGDNSRNGKQIRHMGGKAARNLTNQTFKS